MSAVAIVEAYSKRWAVEPLFAALKLGDRLGAMWQRGRTALLRWLHLVQIGRALLVLLTARAEPQTLALVRVGGWRRAATLTPGLARPSHHGPIWQRRPLLMRAFWAWRRSVRRPWAR